MSAPSMPTGRHIVAFNQIRTVAGGQTHSLLQRTWLFAEEAQVETTIVTFDAYPDYDGIEAELRSRRKLHATARLCNIYDTIRDADVVAPSAAPGLTPLDHLKRTEELRSDGAVWRTRYDDPVNLQPMFYDYRRVDGSTYLRTPPMSMDEFRDDPDLIQVVDPEGRVASTFRSLGEWWSAWLSDLTRGDRRVYLFVDSMMLPPHLADRLPSRFHQIVTMHMAHVYHPRRWNSPLHEPARRSLDQLGHFDAFVILTERQRADVEMLYGRRSNLYVLPNPGELAQPPDPAPARERRLVVIARLTRVKRVEDAIRAFAIVLGRVPDAKLDIFGDGRLRLPCQRLIEALGISSSVTMHGHRPDAREHLWTASALLLSSRSEGYPLAPLEAFARCCPVVSYDIKYGPREQIEDGVSGLLAPAGDVETLAAHCVRLLESPETVRRMGAAGRARVERDRRLYVGRWAAILRDATDARPFRTSLDSVRLSVRTLRPTRRSIALFGRRDRSLLFRGVLDVRAAKSESSLSDATVELQAVDDKDGSVAALPVEWTATGKSTLVLRSVIRPDQIFRELPGGRGEVRLRLRLTWQNSYWELDLRRPPDSAPRSEIAYLRDGRIRLRRNRT